MSAREGALWEEEDEQDWESLFFSSVCGLGGGGLYWRKKAEEPKKKKK